MTMTLPINNQYMDQQNNENDCTSAFVDLDNNCQIIMHHNTHGQNYDNQHVTSPTNNHSRTPTPTQNQIQGQKLIQSNNYALNMTQPVGISPSVSPNISQLMMGHQNKTKNHQQTNDVTSSQLRPYVRIIEQPAKRARRFRYACESRSAGSWPGVNSTGDKKTFPAIQIMNYVGRAVVVVSCVTKDYPFRPHPHKLVGKEGCKNGICTVVLNGQRSRNQQVQGSENGTITNTATGQSSMFADGENEVNDDTNDNDDDTTMINETIVDLNNSMICTFNNLGIQCVKRKEIEESLKLRESKQVDPFRTGFAHKSRMSDIDLSALRLCFQVFIEPPGQQTGDTTSAQATGGCTHQLVPVVSDVIHDKKAMSDLVITKLSHVTAPATGGREIILLCDKVSRDDIQCRFYQERDGKCLWESYAEFDIHKQVAMCIKTPKYYDENIQQPVMVSLQLRRPSDNQCSDPIQFQFLPCESDDDIISRKRPKIYRVNLDNYVRTSILEPLAASSSQSGVGVGPIIAGAGGFMTHHSQQHQFQHHQFPPTQVSFAGQHSSGADVAQQHVRHHHKNTDDSQQQTNQEDQSRQRLFSHPFSHSQVQSQPLAHAHQIVNRFAATGSQSQTGQMQIMNETNSDIQMQQQQQHQQQYLQQQRRLQQQLKYSPITSPISQMNQDYVNITQQQAHTRLRQQPQLRPTPPPHIGGATMNASRQQLTPSALSQALDEIVRQTTGTLTPAATAVPRHPHALSSRSNTLVASQTSPSNDQLVVKHEIIDDEGNVIQIVDRPNTSRIHNSSRDNLLRQCEKLDRQLEQPSPDTALSAKLDELAFVETIDTNLGFNSSLIRNLDGNTETRSTNIINGPGVRVSAGDVEDFFNNAVGHESHDNIDEEDGEQEDEAGEKNSNDNSEQNNSQTDCTLNTPQVSEIEPQIDFSRCPRQNT